MGEAAAIVLLGDDAEQHLAEALDSLRACLAVGGGDAGALRLRQAAFELAAAFGQFEQPLPAVLGATMLHDEPLANELAEHPVKALLGDAQNAEQLADRHLRMAPDKVHHPVMRPPESVLFE